MSPAANFGKHGAALLLAFALAAVVHVALFGSWQAFHARLDFNTGPLEDFTGPYYRQALAVGNSNRLEDWFLYPPSFACLLRPLAAMSQTAAAWTWLGILLGASALLVLVGWSLLDRPSAWVTLALGLCFALGYPWVHDLHWGQVSTLVWALALFGLWAWRRSHPWWGAMALGLAIAIKVFPAWFLLALWMRGDRKQMARVVLVASLWMLGLPLWVMGWQATMLFYQDLWAGWGHAFDTLFWNSKGSQFGPAVLARLWDHPGGVLGVLQWVVPYALALWFVWLAKAATARGEVVVGWVLLAAALPQVLSPSWAHYFVWLPVGSAILFGRSAALVPRSLLASACLMSSVPFFVWVGGYPEYPQAGWLNLASLCLPLAYLLQGSILVDERRSGVGQQAHGVQA